MARVSVWTIRRQERLPCAGVIDGDFFSVVAAPHRRHVVRSTYAFDPPLSSFSHTSHLSISDQFFHISAFFVIVLGVLFVGYSRVARSCSPEDRFVRTLSVGSVV